jgi:hypothetical protein
MTRFGPVVGMMFPLASSVRVTVRDRPSTPGMMVAIGPLDVSEKVFGVAVATKVPSDVPELYVYTIFPVVSYAMLG